MNKKELLEELDKNKRELNCTVAQLTKEKSLGETLINHMLEVFYDVKSVDELKKQIRLSNGKCITVAMNTKHLTPHIMTIKILNRILLRNKLKESYTPTNEELIKLAEFSARTVKESYATKEKIKGTTISPLEDLYNSRKSLVKRFLSSYDNFKVDELRKEEEKQRKEAISKLALEYHSMDSYKDFMDTYYRAFYGMSSRDILKSLKIRSINSTMNKEHLKYKNMIMGKSNIFRLTNPNEKEFLESVKNLSTTAKDLFIDEHHMTPIQNLANLAILNKEVSEKEKSSIRKRTRRA